MTKEELEKATGQELIDERNYCGVDGYYGVYLDNVNAEMLKRFNRLAELEDKLANADYQLEGRDIKIAELETRCNELFLQTCEQAEKIKELEAQIEKMKCCKNCIYQGECDLSGYEECKNFDKWEIKEK